MEDTGAEMQVRNPVGSTASEDIEGGHDITRPRKQTALTPNVYHREDPKHYMFNDYLLPLLSVGCFSYIGVWARVLCGQFSANVGLANELDYSRLLVLDGKGYWLANVVGCFVMVRTHALIVLLYQLL